MVESIERLKMADKSRQTPYKPLRKRLLIYCKADNACLQLLSFAA